MRVKECILLKLVKIITIKIDDQNRIFEIEFFSGKYLSLILEKFITTVAWFSGMITRCIILRFNIVYFDPN